MKPRKKFTALEVQQILSQKFGVFTLFLLVVACSPSPSPKPSAPSPVPAAAASNAGGAKPIPNARNQPPSIQSLEISPAAPLVTDTLRVEIEAKDPDGDAINYHYQWLVNEKPVPGEVQSSLTPGGFLKGDQITCQVLASDGLSQTAPQLSPPAQVANSPPKILRIDFAPERPTKLTGLELKPVVEDADQDKLTLRYTWYHEGKPLPQATTEKLEGTMLKKGTYYWAQVQVDDGAAQSEMFSLRIPIADATPTIQSKPPLSIKGTQSYSYQVQASDVDDEPLTYEVKGPEGVTISPSGLLTWQPKPSQIGPNHLEVIVKDPEGAAVTQSFDLSISLEKPKDR